VDGTGSGFASVISFVISGTVSLESAVLASLISLHENKSRFYWKNSQHVPRFTRFCLC
jgi:hypothetical protein